MLSRTQFSFSVKLLMVGVVIVAVVQEFKTANLHILHIDSIIFKTALGLFIAFTFSPFLVLLVTLLVSGRKSEAEVGSRSIGRAPAPRQRKSPLLPSRRACFCGNW